MGGLQGGVGPEKKVPKKIMKVGPNQKKVPEKNPKKNISVPNLLYTPYGRVSEKQLFFYRKKKFEKKKVRPTGGSVVPQGGDCRGV